MDARTDHYAELLISAKAPHIGDAITPEAFARAVWSFARSLSAERARLVEEALQRIPAPAAACAPGGESPRLNGSPTASAVGAGDVPAELAPFLEATRDLRGFPTHGRRCQVESFPDPDSGAVRCPDPAVEVIGVALLCFAHARIEFAYIAQESGIEAAREEAFNVGGQGKPVEDSPVSTSIDSSRERPRPAVSASTPEGTSETDAGHVAEPQVRPVPAAAPDTLPSASPIRGPAAPSEASRGGIAPAAPEDGAQPHEEVAGHAAEPEVAAADAGLAPGDARSAGSEHEAPGRSETAPQSALSDKFRQRDTLKDAARQLDQLPQLGREVFTNSASREADPPQSGKRGRKKKAEPPVTCRTTEQPEDKQVPLVTWPRWGHVADPQWAWHRFSSAIAAEAHCGEAIDSDLVWLQPGEDRDPEQTCLDCAADAERHVPMAVETGIPGVTAIAHVAPDIDVMGKAALEDIAKAAAKMMRESIPRAGKKKAATVTSISCGGADCSLTGTVEHHNPATCPRFRPKEPAIPRREAIKRAGELAAQFEGKAP